MIKYFQIVIENSRFWGFVDYNVDFIIKIFFNNFETLKPHIDSIKSDLIKIIKYLKENYFAPTMIPSKNVVMHKKKNILFSNKISQMQVNNFMQRFTNISNEKISKLKDIYNSK